MMIKWTQYFVFPSWHLKPDDWSVSHFKTPHFCSFISNSINRSSRINSLYRATFVSHRWNKHRKWLNLNVKTKGGKRGGKRSIFIFHFTWQSTVSWTNTHQGSALGLCEFTRRYCDNKCRLLAFMVKVKMVWSWCEHAQVSEKAFEVKHSFGIVICSWKHALNSIVCVITI